MQTQKGKFKDRLITNDSQQYREPAGHFRETAGFKPNMKGTFNQKDFQNNQSNKTQYNNNRNSMYPYSESGNDALQYSQSNIMTSKLQQQPQITPRRLDILTNNNSVLRESSVIFMSKLHFKPFHYGRCLEKLNTNMLENVNIEQVEYNQDITSSQKVLKNIAFTEFTPEVVEKMGYENFNKIFRLWQLAILNYGVQQQEEQQKGEKLYTKYRSYIEASQKIDEIKQAHANKKTKLYEQIKTLQWQINELKQLGQKQGKFKCTYCTKLFENQEDIKNHIKSAHKDKIEKIKEDQRAIENYGNPLRTMTKREERHLQEQNEQLAQKVNLFLMEKSMQLINKNICIEQVAKEVEEKMNNQLKTLFEKHSELSKRKRDEELRNEFNQDTNDELQQNQKHLLSSISKMNNVFGGFEEMFAQMQTKQQSLLEEQSQYSKRLKEIESDQRKLESEKERQNRELQEQLKMLQQSHNQTRQLEMSISRNEDEHSQIRSVADELQLSKEPSFGNPYMNQQRNNQARRKQDDFLFELVEEDENKENYVQNRSSHVDQYYNTQSQITNTQFQLNQTHLDTSLSASKRSDLKKQFQDKYKTEDQIKQQSMISKKKPKLNHIGDLESDYDSDLLEESYEEGVLQPTNQHQIFRKAEIEFKEKLMTEKERDLIEKNNQYRKAQDLKNKKGSELKKKYNYPFETNKILTNFSTLKQEVIKNERLIEEVMEMKEMRERRNSGENLLDEGEDDDGIYQNLQDIQQMKKHFIKTQLKYDFQDDQLNIDDLDQDQFDQLKTSYQQKYNPKSIINYNDK